MKERIEINGSVIVAEPQTIDRLTLLVLGKAKPQEEETKTEPEVKAIIPSFKANKPRKTSKKKSKGDEWSKEDLEFLKQNFWGRKDERSNKKRSRHNKKVAKELGRTLHGCRIKFGRQGFGSKNKSPKPTSSKDEDFKKLILKTQQKTPPKKQRDFSNNAKRMKWIHARTKELTKEGKKHDDAFHRAIQEWNWKKSPTVKTSQKTNEFTTVENNLLTSLADGTIKSIDPYRFKMLSYTDFKDFVQKVLIADNVGQLADSLGFTGKYYYSDPELKFKRRN